MTSSKLRMVYVILLPIGLIWFTSACSDNGDSANIPEKEAIEFGKRECMIEGSNMDPFNIQTELLTWEKANQKLGGTDLGETPKSTMTWLVSMDGSFLVYGPPAPEGSPNKPIDFPHCSVILDAKTGQHMRSIKTGSD